MNLIKIMQKFSTQDACIYHLEKMRWGGNPKCPYCSSLKISRHASKDRSGSRWQCQKCHKAFSVTVGTIFHKTRLPIQTWFLAIALILNAKKSLSNRQLGRDLGLPCNTAWKLAKKIREGFLGNQSKLLHGIVEMDETYIGGKPRYKGTSKRGRGTKKMPVIGAVERYGKVIAHQAKKTISLSAEIKNFVKSKIDLNGSILITDEFGAYKGMTKLLPHYAVNHGTGYVVGDTHTNTIESFWALIKRSLYGQHHHYSREYADLYIGEACYRYNNRKNENVFLDTIKRFLKG